MWLIHFYLSGLFQWVAENLPTVLATPFVLLAVLYWRKAKACAEKDMEIQRLHAALLNTTVTIEYVREWIVCPGCLCKKDAE